MPELPEVEVVRQQLEAVMLCARLDRVVLRRGNLRTPFSKDFRARLEGQTVQAVSRRAKYLLVSLSSGDTLLMHLGMSGAFGVEQPGNSSNEVQRDPHDHVLFAMSTGHVIVFNDPRRFGFMELVHRGALHSHPSIAALGPEPLSQDFDAAALARACARRKTTLKAALMDQRVVAGLGNIYASEALHVARLSPQRLASTLATPKGSPREPAFRLAAAIKVVLERALLHGASTTYRGSRFRVYDREGARCQRRGCRGIVRRLALAGRSTFYCGVCQR